MSISDIDKPGRICRLNVGGVRYTTALTTLTKYPDSMLGRMFGGEIPTAKDDDGAFFIDRDGDLFRHVINFLRTDRLDVQKAEREALKVEADFYQIFALIEALDQHHDPISLNIGGHHHSTTIEIIKKYPDSLLFCMLEGSVPTPLDANGAFFIDRDGAVFRHVLNFMRNDQLILPEDFSEFEMLEKEAEFYQVASLLKAVTKFRSCNNIVDVVERSDVNFIMVKAPKFILNHPDCPKFEHYHRYDRDEEFYRQRGYQRFNFTKTDFCEFLLNVKCRPYESSMSMSTKSSDGQTITKTIERWYASRRTP